MNIKNRLATTLFATGLLRLLEALPRRPQLIVINYHRIGDAGATSYDPGVFSASADGFDEQIRLLKSKYRFATVKQATDIIERREELSEAMLLVTFDDGYRDNFEFAFPILQRHGVEAIFFLVSAATGTDRLFWWDEIAYLARLWSPKTLQINYPHTAHFDLNPERYRASLRKLLDLYKSPATTDPQRFLALMKEGMGLSNERLQANLIMSWDDARALRAGGMTIGLHSHTHRILAKLTLEQQIADLAQCRAKIEKEIGSEAALLAYPNGSREAFNTDSIIAAREIGVRAAFSFYGGANLNNNIDAFDIRRIGFGNYPTTSRVRLAAAAMAVTGRKWI